MGPRSLNKAPPPGMFRALKQSSGSLCGTLKHQDYKYLLPVKFTQHVLGTAQCLSAQMISHIVFMSRTGTDSKNTRIQRVVCVKRSRWIRSGTGKLDQITHTLNGNRYQGTTHTPQDMWRGKKNQMMEVGGTLWLVNRAITGKRGPTLQSPCRPYSFHSTENSISFNWKIAEAAISHDFM